MCGLAGFVDLDRPPSDEAYAILETMGDALERRGPDDFGMCYLHEVGLGFAHRRLAIHDLSPLGRQPITSSDGRWVLVFNGEIYNYKEIRSRVKARGVALRGESDTEVLVEAIALWGVDAVLPDIAGMFAFVAYDQLSRKLWMARDRAGEKPLFYGWNGRRLYFASTISAIETHPKFDGKVNPHAIVELLRRKCIPAPLSIYQGIHKLEPACRIKLDLAQAVAEPSLARYWDLPTADSCRTATLAELESTLRTVVSEQVCADRPLGAFLSGGIDSSVVVSMMAEVSEQTVKTFTIGFDDRRFDEARYARTVAEHFGTEHEEVYFQPNEALEFVDALGDCYDEPFADASQLPTMLVSRVAREYVVVALSGDGGDESFGGYDRYPEAMTSWRRLERFPLSIRRAASAAMRAAGRPGLDAWLPVMLEALRLRRKGRSASSALHYWAGFLETESLADLYAGKLSAWRNPEAVVMGAAQGREQDVGSAARSPEWGDLRSMMALDFFGYLPDDVLVKVDRASMYFGLEVRSPFLDHRVVELAWGLPEKELRLGGVGKAPLRALLRSRLPAQVFERRKRGFAVPLGDWLRGPLRQWAEEHLSLNGLREAGLDPTLVTHKWRQHLEGTWDNSAQIWTVLMLMNWHRKRREKAPRLSDHLDRAVQRRSALVGAP